MIKKLAQVIKMANSLKFIEQVMKSLPSLILPSFLFILFLYKCLNLNTKSPATGKRLPPSPPKLPIIGNLHQVGRCAHHSFYTLSQRYGSLMFLQLGSMPTVIVSSAKSASLVLKTFDSAFSGRPTYKVAKTLFYDGKDLVFGQYGERWRYMRSVCVLQLLTNKRVLSFRKDREEEVALMLDNIRKSSIAKSSSSGVINLSEMLATLTSDVVCRVAFGSKYSSGKEGANLAVLLKSFAELFGSQNIEDVLPWMSWINRINGLNAKASNFRKLYDELFETILVEHRSRVEDGAPPPTKDFVDILLEAQRDDHAKYKFIDNECIKALILDMFAAGTHTGAVTMEWAFTEMLRHPRVMKRLQQEVGGIVGDKECVSEEDLESMVYLKAVIKETFRLHPPLPLLVPRECTEDVTDIDGYLIPAGTQVLINAWAIGRDPACWEEPESFVPERFLDSTIDFKGQDFELIPFGGGRRGCPAISFAMVNIELVLANLVHQFEWRLPIGVEKEALDMSESSGLSSHRLTPLLVVPTPMSV